MILDAESSLPLYRQIALKIEEDIRAGFLNEGDQLWSINRFSEEHEIARDTVERAYTYLRERGIIYSSRGKGYYIASSSGLDFQRHIFVHFNKLSLHKKIIFESFRATLDDAAQVEIFIHHDNLELFEAQLLQNIKNFTHFVIIPPNTTSAVQENKLSKLFQKVPRNKLYILEKLPLFISAENAVYQDYVEDIYTVLSQYASEIKYKYKKIDLIFPMHKGYARDILNGFSMFCVKYGIHFNVFSEVDEQEVIQGTLYVVIDDEDLVRLIQKIQQKGMQLSEEVGILSYNDTVLKEILMGGISVVSTDFKAMGTKMAEMVMGREDGLVKNDFYLKKRVTF